MKEASSAANLQNEEVSLGERLVNLHPKAEPFFDVGWAGSSVMGFRDDEGKIRSFRSGKLVCLDKPAVIETSEEALRDGVVLGRYARCSGSHHLAGFDHASRVHCLIWLKDNDLWIIDTASTNGTKVQKPDGSKTVAVVSVVVSGGRVCAAASERG